MSNRHKKIGIKQALRLEWMDKVLDLKLAGLSKKDIRKELHIYLADKKDDGTIGKRGEATRDIAVCMLMNIWGAPQDELISFNQELLAQVKNNNRIIYHWAMISSAYPFWFKVAFQTGRLFNLQEQTTKKQIIQRIREEYGDRSSVIRSAQRVIQAFVAWGLLKESTMKGCYEKGETIIISDYKPAVTLIESSLYATEEGKASISMLVSNPALFPFKLPIMTGDTISQYSTRIEVANSGFGNELLTLNRKKL